MSRVKPKEAETPDAFLARINSLQPQGAQAVTWDDLVRLNPTVDEGMTATQPAWQLRYRKNKFCDKDSFPDGVEVGFDASDNPDLARNTTWTVMGGVADPMPFWLGFETLWNAPKFRKGPGRHNMGLYTMPLDQLIINMDADLPDALYAAFFPGISKEVVKAHANVKGAWEGMILKGQKPPLAVIDNAGQGQANNVARNVPQQIQARPYAVLPYNCDDNTTWSNAIGTKAERKLTSTWNMWSTASRSSVVEVAPVDTSDRNLLGGDGTAAWNFGYNKIGNDRPRTTPFAVNNPFRIGGLGASHFSIKTGIEMVGEVFQGGKDKKDVLEWNNALAMLRSYHIRSVEEVVGTDDAMVILGELLTVTNKTSDGFQVRDLRPLVPRIAKGCWYLPALSVPYFGLQVVRSFIADGGQVTKDLLKYGVSPGFFVEFDRQLAKQFAVPATPTPNDQANFEYYWGRYYAIQLGIVKAKLLLRYGLQWMMPNPQNMVIELDPRYKCTSTMILRDVGDWDIHSDVAVAIWGTDPSKPREVWSNYDNVWLQIEYHPKVKSDLHKGVPNDIYTPYENKSIGTQLGWAGYSTFKVWGAERWDLDVSGTGLTDACLIRWGALHNEAYFYYLEQNANINVADVRAKNLELLTANLAGALPPAFSTMKSAEVDQLCQLLHTTVLKRENLEKIANHHKELAAEAKEFKRVFKYGRK